MSIPVFKSVNTDDNILQKIQDSVSDTLNAIAIKELVDGVLLEGIALSAGQANLVPHYLQRNPKGYFVVKKRPALAPVTGVAAASDLGTERLWPFASPPFGWAICNGQAISRTTYSSLFALIGTTYGVGDGSTTFNLPDNRGKAPVGKTASGTGSTLNATFGNLDFTVSIPAHFHGMGTGADLNITASGGTTTGAGSPHNHGITDPGHDNGVGINYIKFVGSGGNSAMPGGTTHIGNGSGVGSNTTGISVNNESAHTHSVPNHTHASGNFAGRIGTVTGGVDGNAAMTSGSANAPSFVRNWIMKIDPNAAFSTIDVWDSDLNSTLQPLYLNLYTSTDATVSLWVF